MNERTEQALLDYYHNERHRLQRKRRLEGLQPREVERLTSVLARIDKIEMARAERWRGRA